MCLSVPYMVQWQQWCSQSARVAWLHYVCMKLMFWCVYSIFEHMPSVAYDLLRGFEVIRMHLCTTVTEVLYLGTKSNIT